MINYLFSFRGRIARLKFWVLYFPLSIIFLVGSISPYTLSLPLITIQTYVGTLPFYLNNVLSVLYILLPLWIYYAIQVKRWHDLNRTGIWALINFIPIIGFLITIFVIGFKKGTIGENLYGKDTLS